LNEASVVVMLISLEIWLRDAYENLKHKLINYSHIC
jgi:hypothetical protein